MKRGGTMWKSFQGSSGTSEHTIMIQVSGNGDLHRQIATASEIYSEILQTLNLPPQTALFRRIFVSDAANQAALLRQSSLCVEPHGSPVAVSLVQQAPMNGAKLSLLAYHIESEKPLVKRAISPRHVLVERDNLRHLWSTGLCVSDDVGPASSARQTQAVFDDLIDTLAGGGGTLAENCVRTWLYLKQVDVFYQDMVTARAALFERHGLTRDTHYIASTGIEGACSHRHDVVLMDAYSILGLAPEQVSYLNDFDRLCATKDYDVTFERGTRVAYADRTHHFISGTASIDAAGRVLHEGDVRRQLDRTLENIDALLDSGGARIEDMSHFIVYLRDPADYPAIADSMAERFPGVPTMIVRGAVCRPQWLVEVEGIATVAHDAPALPAF
jgi:enamine deaminase RidA (YjgF/YER057c/UK114 family)